MKIFVINLKKDIERRNSIQSQLDKLNVSFEFVSGVYGKDLTDSELSMRYDNFKSKRTQSRSLTRSEIGCALSHIKTYKKIIDKNIELALILEDDVVVPDNLLQVLLKVEKLIDVNIPQVTLLSPVESYKTQLDKVIIDEIYSLLQYKKGYFASSYIVNLNAAKTLLKELYPIGDVADCWKRLRKHKIVEINAITPPLIHQNREKFGSSTTLDIKKHQKTDVLSKIRFKISRVFWLSYDTVLALYNRNIRPYGGMKL